MGTREEETEILKKILDDSMIIRTDLDYDNVQFGIRISHRASASDMGGVFSVCGADSGMYYDRNIIGFSIADVQGWTKEYGETVARDMIRYAICHEMYFLKDMEKDAIVSGSSRRCAGHGICYLKREIAPIRDGNEKAIQVPYSRAAYADAYAFCILGMSMEYGYEPRQTHECIYLPYSFNHCFLKFQYLLQIFDW